MSTFVYLSHWLVQQNDCDLSTDISPYSPRELALFILAAIYILPEGDVHESQQALEVRILCGADFFHFSLIIILDDFNKGNLSQELPKYSLLNARPEQRTCSFETCSLLAETYKKSM